MQKRTNLLKGLLGLCSYSLLLSCSTSMQLDCTGKPGQLYALIDANNARGVAAFLNDTSALDVDACCPDHPPALIRAAQHGDAKMVGALLGRGANPNIKFIDPASGGHCTAYRVAIKQGHAAVARLLLETNKNVEGQDEVETPDLVYAAKKNFLELAKVLLEKGANPKSKDGAGNTALGYAAENNSLELAAILLDKGADPDEKNAEDATLLMWAAKNNSVELARLLLRYKADPNKQTKLGYTALMLSALNENANMARILLEGGADPALRDSMGSTALLRAANRDRREMVRLLLADKRTTPTVIDAQGDFIFQSHKVNPTALIGAASMGHVDIVRQLLEKGANPTIRDKNNRTALDYARTQKHTKVIWLLSQAIKAHKIGEQHKATGLGRAKGENDKKMKGRDRRRRDDKKRRERRRQDQAFIWKTSYDPLKGIKRAHEREKIAKAKKSAL